MTRNGNSTRPQDEAHNPPTTPATLHARVGQLSTEFSSLEFMLHAIVWNLVNVERPEVGAAVTEGITQQPLARLLKRLSRTTTLDLGGRVLEAAKGFEKLIERRNEVVHSLVLHDADTARLQGLKRFARDVQRQRSVNADVEPREIDNLLIGCSELRSELVDLMLRLPGEDSYHLAGRGAR